MKNIIEIISRAAGWTEVPPDEEGGYHYFLEGGLDLDIRCPDDRCCVLSTVLEPAPSSDQPEAAREHWLRLGLAACAVMNAQGSILAKKGEEVVLYRRLDLDELNEAEIVDEVRDFLNDQAWWRRFLSQGEGSMPSAFSTDFSMWFPPQFSF